ncbi:MAG: hypothetical protein J3K34DRAFT_523727 [Monoraphidium minutum]|nr:MAG: hypothetical protein J3K34DRAFT_523727 [Monoraphidium minutum]
MGSGGEEGLPGGDASGSRRRQRYYTPYEVSVHNTPQDCWVSFLGGVYDLSQLIQDNPGRQAAPIIAAAGADISHWFDPETGDVRTYVHPDTQLRGEFVHVHPMWPLTGVDVGALSTSTRLVRVRNVLTGQEDELEVPSEETVGEVEARYLAINAHAASYTWKALARAGGKGGAAPLEWVDLDLSKSLADNGVPDERPAFEAAGLPGGDAVPVLHVYWNDDLTVA